jgi:uridine phosphorylase
MRPDLGPVGEVGGREWRRVLGLADAESPVAVIVEGSWWRAERTRRRVGRLADARELGVPDVWIGTMEDARTVLYACLYGAPRAAEVVHIAARVGIPLAIQLGSCGIVGAGIRPGDVIVPDEALGEDGVSRLYAPDARIAASARWSGLAVTSLRARGLRALQGSVVSWPTLFHQPLETVRGWQRDGHLGVDMESAATLAVARHAGIAAVSMLVAWDDVLSGRSFLDPLAPSDLRAFEAADEAIVEVAIELAALVPMS